MQTPKFESSGPNLLKNGRICNRKRGNRLTVMLHGEMQDCASIVFKLHYGFWPPFKLKFFDGNYENLSIENLALSKIRGDRALMRRDHDRNLPKAVLVFCRSGKELSEAFEDLREEPKTCKRKPCQIEGRTWWKHKGHWIAITPANHVSDDYRLRLDRTLRQGDPRYVKLIVR